MVRVRGGPQPSLCLFTVHSRPRRCVFERINMFIIIIIILIMIMIFIWIGQLFISKLQAFKKQQHGHMSHHMPQVNRWLVDGVSRGYHLTGGIHTADTGHNWILIGRSTLTGLWSDCPHSFWVEVSGSFRYFSGYVSLPRHMPRVNRRLVSTI